MNVKNIMIRDLVKIGRENTIADAMTKMYDERVTSLVVDKGENDKYGMITRMDILAKVIVAEKDPQEIYVKDVMSEHLQTVSPDDSIQSVATMMAKSHMRRFPVMDGDMLVGLISNSDILNAEMRMRVKD